MTMVADVPMQAEISSIEPLTDTILRVILKPPHYVPYQAGQYLQILMATDALSYSIANAPLGAHCYELHVRHHPAHVIHQHVLQEMRAQGEVPIFLPLGNCHVGQLDVTRPTLLLGQGTGFAPLKAIIEQWLADGLMPPTVLCWMVRSAPDWYMDDLVQQWVERVPAFRYLPCLMDNADEAWVEKLLSFAEFDVSKVQVVLAGPFERMRSLRDVMISHGIGANQFFSDAFE
ncbi:MAG: NAD(P)H-flavin reductase [Gammaproteobacteria bacterium]|nr:NAD(P)H-flavin reductase [Gammaproteobacteria bacterium]